MFYTLYQSTNGQLEVYFFKYSLQHHKKPKIGNNLTTYV